MYRYEDQGLTLRLFKDEHDAKIHSDAVSVARYGPGAIAKNKLGRWLDAHGVLPFSWTPSAKLLTFPKQHGFYVDANGKASCADVAPRGCHYSFHEKASHREVWIVTDSDGEVLEEYVLWPSLEALAGAGGNLSCKRPSAQARKAHTKA